MMTAGDQKRQEKADRKERRAICAACPHASSGLIKVCGFCNCPIVFVTISGPCPLNKW